TAVVAQSHRGGQLAIPGGTLELEVRGHLADGEQLPGTGRRLLRTDHGRCQRERSREEAERCCAAHGTPPLRVDLLERLNIGCRLRPGQCGREREAARRCL